MSYKEKSLQVEDMAAYYIQVAEKYSHDAIFIFPNPDNFENTLWLLETIHEKSGDQYFIMMHGDPAYGIPDGDSMEEFSRILYEDEDECKKRAQKELEARLRFAEELKNTGLNLLDGFALCSDYCFNVNSFFFAFNVRRVCRHIFGKGDRRIP